MFLDLFPVVERNRGGMFVVASQASVQRVRVRHCAVSGNLTGAFVKYSTLSDLDIDWTPRGIYLEHYTTNSVFQRIHVHSRVSHGIRCEWASPMYSGTPASIDNVIQDSVFESTFRRCVHGRRNHEDDRSA